MYKQKYFKYKTKYLKLKKQKGGAIPEIQEAWKKIIEDSSYLKTTYKKNFDGLKYWKSVKPFLNDIDSRLHSKVYWNPNHQNVISNFSHVRSEIPEKDGDELIEKNHFLLQQLNIPTKDGRNPSFRRLMQLALNIGQLQSFTKPFSDDIQKLIIDNNLSDINTYMTSDNYNKYIFNNSDLIKLIGILDVLRRNPPKKLNN